MKTVKYKNGDVYVGETKGLFNPQREGFGTLKYANGDVYKGDWREDMQWGEGTLTYACGDVFKGRWRKGVMSEGRLDYKNGDYYEGHFSGGKYGGDGTLFIKSNGTTYVGQFNSGRKHGTGTEKCKEYTYRGRFASDRFHFEGRLEKKNGDWFEGTFHLGKFIRGKCRMTEADGTVYQGDIVGGVYDGEGELTFKNGAVFVGSFKEGKCTGEGKLTLADGSVLTEEFENDKLRSYAVNGVNGTSDTEVKAESEKLASKPEKAAKTVRKKKTEGVENKAPARKKDTSAKVEKKLTATPDDKAYAELEAEVKRAIDDAMIQYEKVLNPKPVIASAPLTTPEIEAREARSNADKAVGAVARFEARCKEEHKYGGALSPDARAYDVRDEATGKINVYRGGLNYLYQPHGYGRMEYGDGTVYEGELECAKCVGVGRFRGGDYTYTGEFSDSSINGVGIRVYDDGDTYKGEFSDGVLRSGVQVNPSQGLRYEGRFGSGLKRNGYGILRINGDEYGFFFVGGYILGNGYYKCEKQIFKGFYNSERHVGSGVIEFSGGSRYEGQVAEYIPDGYGRFTDAQGNVVMARFVKGKPEGIYILIPKDGKPIRG